MKIIHKECDPLLGGDKSLPRNSFLVSYKNNDILFYDIVQSSSTVEVFNKYWDEYRSVLSIEWTSGITNPKGYGVEPKDNKKNK